MGEGWACRTCRYWDATGEECRRHPPVLLPLEPPAAGRPRPGGTGARAATAARWPRTAASDWCGEWQPARTATEPPAPPPPVAPPTAIGELAARRFVRRMAPGLRTTDPAGVLAPLLGQLPPDVRQVVVRLHGLDGKVADDVKRVAAETGLSPQRVRGLRSAGEYLLRDAFVLLTDRQLAAESAATEVGHPAAGPGPNGTPS